MTGKYRGPTHSCNLNYRIPDYIPVKMHNLPGHDSHLLIKELGSEIDAIPNTDEKYISFTKNRQSKKLRFIDSFNPLFQLSFFFFFFIAVAIFFKHCKHRLLRQKSFI